LDKIFWIERLNLSILTFSARASTHSSNRLPKSRNSCWAPWHTISIHRQPAVHFMDYSFVPSSAPSPPRSTAYAVTVGVRMGVTVDSHTHWIPKSVSCTGTDKNNGYRPLVRYCSFTETGRNNTGIFFVWNC